MNKLLLILAFVTIAIAGSAQDTSSTSKMLTFYYNIKDALVSGNAEVAASNAKEFVRTASTIDQGIISEKAISPITKDAEKISATTDLKKQREYFMSFSTNMTAVAKSVKLSREPVYVAYCPMKKGYWLSSEKAIKNPYYGSSMLGCGEIKETINND